MGRSFFMLHKLKTKEHFQEYASQVDLFDKCLEAINKLPYYQTHKFRKNGVMCLHLYMSSNDTTINHSQWQAQNLVWCHNYFKDSVFLDNRFEIMDDMLIHDIYIIPLSPRGAISCDYYCGSPYKMRFMFSSYSNHMHTTFGLQRTRASVVRRSAKSGIYRSYDFPREIQEPPTIAGQSIEEYQKAMEQYIARLQNYYEQKLEAQKSLSNQTLITENKHLRKENTRLSKYIEPYLNFIEKYGGLNKAGRMLQTAQFFQYAIRLYQENADQESIDKAMQVIADGQTYLKKHS